MSNICIKNKDRYETNISNILNIWKDRFVYKEKGKYSKYTVSIVKFAKDTNVFSTMKICKTSKEFYKEIDRIAKEYGRWCKENGCNIKSEDLINFFKGAIGEYFFYIVLTHVTRFYIEDNGKGVQYIFNSILPQVDADYGVDLTGVLSYNGMDEYDCAIQVKFWNPTKMAYQFTNDTASKVYGNAVANQYIYPYDDKNIVLCWLSTKDKLSIHLKENKAIYRHLICIDNDVLDRAINNQDPNFWRILQDKLIEISTI